MLAVRDICGASGGNDGGETRRFDAASYADATFGADSFNKSTIQQFNKWVGRGVELGH